MRQFFLRNVISDLVVHLAVLFTWAEKFNPSSEPVYLTGASDVSVSSTDISLCD